ncbi:MAG: epoxyqueuosine reductase [Sulfitobacter sp.]|jgi:epoxyqueuosine reductase
MISLAELEAGAATRHLVVLGVLSLEGDADAPKGMTRLVLLGPAPGGFWPAYQASPEAQDAAPDPIDRWSRRVIGTWACDLKGKALFPFGGPPYRPFLRWAASSGRAWSSPVGALVHDRFGLMVSYRGALAVPDAFDLPGTGPRPCETCADQPCLTACPVGALSESPYDVPACKSHIASQDGADCLTEGCRVRRVCPLSLGAGRDPAQSAYHMSLFLGPQ